MAFRKYPTSLSKAPPPETNVLRDPPNCNFILFLTNFSKIMSCIFSKKVKFSFFIFFNTNYNTLKINFFFNPVAFLKLALIF